MGQNHWYHFQVGAPPILVYSSGDWDVHWGYGFLTHGHIPVRLPYLQIVGLRESEALLGLVSSSDSKYVQSTDSFSLHAFQVCSDCTNA